MKPRAGGMPQAGPKEKALLLDDPEVATPTWPVVPQVMNFEEKLYRASMLLISLFALYFVTSCVLDSGILRGTPRYYSKSFYASINVHHDVCTGEEGRAVSRSGYIGLDGDAEEAPKRSFFW